jgi:hypothetical protein
VRERRMKKRNNANNILSSERNAKTIHYDWKFTNEDCPPYDSSLFSSESVQSPSIRFLSFDDLFPNNKFSELFNNDSLFREDIRSAARNDFFVYDNKLSSEANSMIKDSHSTLMSSWKRDNEYRSLTSVFQKYNLKITGPKFIDAFTDICSSSPSHFGSWIDICGVPNKTIAHSWHQDSGLDQVNCIRIKYHYISYYSYILVYCDGGVSCTR